jgi:hypothetical protein
MILHGSLSDNLRATLASIRRHRGRDVHADTMDYWEQLLAYARETLRKGRSGPEVADFTRQIGIELAEREISKVQGMR